MTHEHDTESWSPDAEPGAAAPGGPTPLPRPGDLLAGRFLIERQLGSGASGIVFAARDERVGQRVAVKVIHPHLTEDGVMRRLRREVQASRSGHPNLVSVYDVHIAGGLTFLSMELVEGSSLRARLDAFKALGVDETVEVGRQIAGALAHLHAAGLVHRDVKPGNVLVEVRGDAAPTPTRMCRVARGEGRGESYEGSGASSDPLVSCFPPPSPLSPSSHRIAKLCDLGLVRPLGHGDTMTASAITVGTPAYMAPEQGRGDDLSGKADIYGLGMTLYECLSGVVPLLSDSAVATLVLRQQSRAPSVRRELPWCPRWLDGLLARMLDPDPRARPSAAEVERTLASRRLRFRLPVKQLVTLGAALALAAAGAAAWQRLRTPETAHVETGGNVVRGVDARGRETWSYTLENPIRQVERADLDGDGNDETLVAAWPDDKPGVRMGQLPLSEFVALRQNGTLVTRIRPEEVVTEWQHPFAKRLVPQIVALQYGSRPTPLVVLNCRHRTFFPDEVLVYRPRERSWWWILDHSGAIYAFAPNPHSDSLALRFVALNNRLSMLPVMGEIALPRGLSSSTTPHRDVHLHGPDYSLGAGSPDVTWSLYLPLEQQSRGPGSGRPDSVEIRPDGATTVFIAGSKRQVDSAGNPIPGPNAGRQLAEQRLRFFSLIERLHPLRQPLDSSSVLALVLEVESTCRDILLEHPYRAILGLKTAHALARIGQQDRALELLLETENAAPYDDVRYKVANLLAVLGRLDQAEQRLQMLASTGPTLRASYDVPQLLIRIAIERQDPDGVLRASNLLLQRHEGASRQPGLEQSILARARLWWDEPRTTDFDVRSLPFFPEGDAIAALARWRVGRSRSEDVEAMRRFAEDTPDGAAEGFAALAAAQIGNGAVSQALTTLDELISALEPVACDDFASQQDLDLALALRVYAKAKLSWSPGLEAEAEAVRRHLAPHTLPFRLLEASSLAQKPVR